MVKKKKELDKRDSKGRFQKGHKSHGGRPKGTIQDVLCKDGKARSVSVLLDDMLVAYGKMGGGKFLAKWAVQNHRNLAKFIDILMKFIPQPTQESTLEFKPLTIQVQKLPEGDAFKLLEKEMKELRDANREQDLELSRMRSIFTSHNIEYTEISHEVVEDKELPEHKEDDEEDHSDRRYK